MSLPSIYRLHIEEVSLRRIEFTSCAPPASGPLADQENHITPVPLVISAALSLLDLRSKPLNHPTLIARASCEGDADQQAKVTDPEH